MASFFSTLLLTPLFSPIKYVFYIPPVLKPKIKFKAKAKLKPKPKIYNLGEAGSSKYNGEWANINNFLTNLLDFKVLQFPDLGLLALIRATNPLDLLY